LAPSISTMRETCHASVDRSAIRDFVKCSAYKIKE
jgi:hypothetical protein